MCVRKDIELYLAFSRDGSAFFIHRLLLLDFGVLRKGLYFETHYNGKKIKCTRIIKEV